MHILIGGLSVRSIDVRFGRGSMDSATSTTTIAGSLEYMDGWMDGWLVGSFSEKRKIEILIGESCTAGSLACLLACLWAGLSF